MIFHWAILSVLRHPTLRGCRALLSSPENSGTECVSVARTTYAAASRAATRNRIGSRSPVAACLRCLCCRPRVSIWNDCWCAVLGSTLSHYLFEHTQSVAARSLGEPLFRTVRAAASGSVIANGGLISLGDCEAVLQESGANAVSIARAYLANPDWLTRMIAKRDLVRYVHGQERLPLPVDVRA